MTQFNYPDIRENRIKDVGIIENLVYSLINSRASKEHSTVYSLLYSLLCAFLGYLAIDSGVMGSFSVLGIAAMLLYPALFSYTLLYSPMIFKAAGTVLPVIMYGIRFFVFPMEYDGYENFVLSMMTFVLCFAAAVIFCVTVFGKKTKLWCFTAVTAAVTAVLVITGLIFLIYTKGSADVSLVVEMVNDGINEMTATFQTALNEELSDSARFEKYKLLIPEIAQLDASEAAELMAQAFKSSLSAFKMLIPSLIILSCMIYGFIFTGIFSRVARFHKMPLFVCIMDSRWCYRIPSSCITFFDIILLFVIIGSIFGLPASIAASVMNLLIIMLPIVTIATFKAIHFFLYGSLRSKSVAYLLCAVIAVVPMMFLGMWGYLLLCSLGVTFVAQRYRIECEAARVKIKSDTELLLALCGFKEFCTANGGEQADSQSSDITDGESREDENSESNASSVSDENNQNTDGER